MTTETWTEQGNTNGYAKVDREKHLRPQFYTKTTIGNWGKLGADVFDAKLSALKTYIYIT